LATPQLAPQPLIHYYLAMHPSLRGFSLIELSIVLVILGLLTGGILAGKSLIRASELRAVSTEYSRWNTAVFAFRDKYFALPGDMANAQAVWGAAANCPGTAAQGSTTATTCNGNGNGMLECVGPTGSGTLCINATGVGSEWFRFWQHLANAGLIEGTFSGVAGTSGNYHAIYTNSPASKLAPGCWSAGYTDSTSGDPDLFNAPGGNRLSFGKPYTSSNASCRAAMLVPEELWNIDSKLDDGRPATGKIQAYYWDDCTDATSSGSINANYSLNVTTPQCALVSGTRW
jgi:prepilin-type N-terminal cleavage/methylation domain-containing protein